MWRLLWLGTDSISFTLFPALVALTAILQAVPCQPSVSGQPRVCIPGIQPAYEGWRPRRPASARAFTAEGRKA